MFCCLFLYSIAANATIHTAAMVPSAAPAFCPFVNPPCDSFDSSFALALLFLEPTVLGGGGDGDGNGGDTSADGDGDGDGDDSGEGGDCGGAGGEMVGAESGEGETVGVGESGDGGGESGTWASTGPGLGACGCTTERSDERAMIASMWSLAIGFVDLQMK